jgi:hypothetical protein
MRVVVEIMTDLAFSVTDEQASFLDERGLPRLGYYGSLLGSDLWLSAAATAVSFRAVVEVWRDGSGRRQELTHLRPVGVPEEFEAPPGCGTRVTFELDPAYFGSGAAISNDIDSLDLHGPYCSEYDGPGYVVLHDRRRDGDPDSAQS